MMQTVHLVVLILVGAGIGNLPQVGNLVAVAEQRFVNTVLGAVCGLGVELMIRAVSKK